MSFVIGFFAMLVLCFLDCTLIYTKLSLVMTVCTSLTGNPFWVVISGLGGIFCDLYLDTFPFFTFVYLYISLGCVYLGSLVFKPDAKVFFVTSLVAVGLLGSIIAGGQGLIWGVVCAFAAFLFYVFLKKEINSEKI